MSARYARRVLKKNQLLLDVISEIYQKIKAGYLNRYKSGTKV